MKKNLSLLVLLMYRRQSAEQVKEVIEAERPDSVCIELDEQRYQSLSQETSGRIWIYLKLLKRRKQLYY